MNALTMINFNQFDHLFFLINIFCGYIDGFLMVPGVHGVSDTLTTGVSSESHVLEIS